ncbi:hypothetical protein [Actinomycetospora straminea]|nr:hypothetical protein [Actinomycetospora straminea]MDD7933171.1 hypothetical protein [Actinomycetospora straminea]
MSASSGGSPLPTPPLCERCWFPVRPGEPVRRRLVRSPDGGVEAGWEHAGAGVPCTPQQPVVEDAA